MTLAERIATARLYAILDTGYLGDRPPEFYAREFIRGGADIIQLRAKHEPTWNVCNLAMAVHEITATAGIPLILNDHPALAASLGLEGAHGGQEDSPVATARAEFRGNPSLIGKSTHSLAQAEAALAEAPDYIGYGPLYPTPTKPDYAPVGLADLADLHRRVALPIFCIGGINLETLDAVVAAGARRIVAVSALMRVASPAAVCREIKDRLPPFAPTGSPIG